MRSPARLLLSIAALTLPTFTPYLRGQTTPTVSTLYSFSAPDSQGFNADGAYPLERVAFG